MTSTALPTLRPLSLGELLDQAFRLYRQNFVAFIGIVAVAQIPIALLDLLNNLMRWAVLTNANSFSTSPIASTYTSLGSCLTFIVGVVQFVLVQCLAVAALTRATSDGFLGQSIRFTEAYRRIRPVWTRLFSAFILAGFTTVALFIWWLVPIIGWFTGLGILFFFSSVINRLMAPTVVLEGKVAGAAIRRSWDLARRRFWWLVGFAVILVVLRYLTLLGPSALVTYLTIWFSQNIAPGIGISNEKLLEYILPATVTLLATVLYLPLESIAVTLVYFDLRIRTEGLDLALLSSGASAKSAELLAALTQAPPPENTGIVSSGELLKFAGLSLIPLVIFGLAYIFIFAAVSSVLTGMLR